MGCYGELSWRPGSKGATKKLAQDGAVRGRPEFQVRKEATDIGSGKPLQVPNPVLLLLRQIQTVRAREGDYFCHSVCLEPQ